MGKPESLIWSDVGEGLRDLGLIPDTILVRRQVEWSWYRGVPLEPCAGQGRSVWEVQSQLSEGNMARATRNMFP